MSHSYCCNFQHIVFSTKDRRPLIRTDLQDSVFAYIGGIARQNGMIAMAVGGTVDHVHLFLVIPPVMPVAKSVQLIKAGSSKWFRETHSRMFAWQQGYGAFSVSKSNEVKVRTYIRNQAQHHKKQDFVAEFKELLRRHGLAFEPSDLE
jgi:REP element-mobilizing transposase RayT